jgi:hypothetical protein
MNVASVVYEYNSLARCAHKGLMLNTSVSGGDNDGAKNVKWH